MLLETPNPKIHLIDFELSSLNHLGGDVVQLLGEMMMDYDKEGDSFSPEDLPCVAHMNEMIKVFCFFFYQKGAFDKYPGSPEMLINLKKSEEFQNFEHESIENLKKAFPLLKKLNDLFWIWRAYFILMTAKDSDVDYLNLVKERAKIMRASYPDLTK